MKQRLQTLLATEKIASSKFADIISVNRSSISHLLSGRNNPSLDFLQKVLVKFPHINPDWLLLGQGSMYRNSVDNKSAPIINQIPFEENQEKSVVKEPIKEEISQPVPPIDNEVHAQEIIPEYRIKKEVKKDIIEQKPQKEIERIVFFYLDQSFDTYFPNK